MEDKTFDLLEKMYIEFTNKIDNLSSEFLDFRKETHERFDRVETDISELKKQGTGLESEIKKTNIAIEQGIKPKLGALFDGYTQTYEKLAVIEEKVDNLSEKVDRHDIKIQVIEGGRK